MISRIKDRYIVYGGLCLLCSSFAQAWVWNNPYPAREAKQNIFYSSFALPPKTLDPAKAYSVNESIFINQINEPLLTYHYLKRPYQLIPLLAQQLPEVRYVDRKGQRILDPAQHDVAYTVYRIHIKPHVYYAPHPAFAKDNAGHALYLSLSEHDLNNQHIQTLFDFKIWGKRELFADDFIYQIKRLASPYVNSPIFSLLQRYIVGFKAFNEKLVQQKHTGWIDLRNIPLEGVKQYDPYTFEIRIKGQYRPFIYWLAMHFFSPIPWEVDRFYAQVGMKERNIGFDWDPIGTGPFMLTENKPHRVMVLSKNPHFRVAYFPSDGSAQDKAMGYLKHTGERLPLVDQAIFTLEKEALPRWNKFLQGYYDVSSISEDSFGEAIRLDPYGMGELTALMKKKKLRLTQSIDSDIFYFGFNMLDPVVGGHSEQARWLRLAISLAVNMEERIALFNNGRGEVAHSVLPPGIFGGQSDSARMNQWLYEQMHGTVQKRDLSLAHYWMHLAGYPRGIDPKTGQPLLLNFDVAVLNGPDEKAQLAWMRKQLAKLGIALNIRATLYNYFQDKMRTGHAQIYAWGWKADYPDPENFLFLLYGPHGKVKYGGENASNYANPTYDQLFQAMINRKDDQKRMQLIRKMIKILQHDAPWIFGYHSKTLTLSQQWVDPVKPHEISTNTLQYVAVDVPLRYRMRIIWNQASLWPIGWGIVIMAVFLFPLVMVYRHHEDKKANRL